MPPSKPLNGSKQGVFGVQIFPRGSRFLARDHPRPVQRGGGSIQPKARRQNANSRQARCVGSRRGKHGDRVRLPIFSVRLAVSPQQDLVALIVSSQDINRLLREGSCMTMRRRALFCSLPGSVVYYRQLIENLRELHCLGVGGKALDFFYDRNQSSRSLQTPARAVRRPRRSRRRCPRLLRQGPQHFRRCALHLRG